MGGRDLDDLVSALDALPGGPILEMPLVLLRLLEDGNGDNAQGRMTATALAQSYVEALPFRQEVMADGEHFSVTLYLTEPAAPIPPARVELTADTTAHLSELAARILVPESEASRLAGAGAGLTDND
ncbi:hypothetical protein [Sulfitobacter aestuariivivens]|uniref:hypothetical protein n=1 Tax=Sulfitobacter aestuariivivens TaxID=2766981 RepID=UPI00360B9C3E